LSYKEFKPVCCFEGYPKCYPIEVFDLCKMYTYGLIGVTQFEREMRKHGVTRARAYVLLGKYQRGEYTIELPDGTEIPGKPKATWLFVTEYYFHWVIKIKYDKRKYHEIFLDVEVMGTLQKHSSIPVPSHHEIAQTLDVQLETQFNNYLKDFWQLRLVDLKYVAEAELETGLEEFRPVRFLILDESVPLEYNIDDIIFMLSRGQGKPYVRRRDLENDLRPYIELALSNTEEMIIDSELQWMMRSSELIEETMEKQIQEILDRVNKEKLIRAIRAIHSVGHIGLIENRIEKSYEEGLIDYETYLELHQLLLEKTRSLTMERARKWCQMIKKAGTIQDLNRILSRIMSSKTWNSFYFQEAKKFVIECANSKMRELLKEGMERREITKEAAHKRVYSYFEKQLRELEKKGTASPTVVRDLRNLLSRVTKSKLKPELKQKLVDEIRTAITKFSEEKCQRFMKMAREASNLKEIRHVKAEVTKQKGEIPECYENLMNVINQKIKGMREQKYGKTIERIEKQLKKVSKGERVDKIIQAAPRILKLPADKQFEVLMKLIHEAESIPELQAVFNIIKKSKLVYNERYYPMVVQLEDAYRKKFWELGS